MFRSTHARFFAIPHGHRGLIAAAAATIAAIAMVGCDYSGNHLVLAQANSTASTTSQGGSTTTNHGGAGGAPTVVSRANVLNAVGKCAAALYEEFATATTELETATRAASDAPSAEATTKARAAWAKTVALWQQTEVIQVGIVGPKSQPEGQGLRDYVYSWPMVSRCMVEQNLVSKSYENLAPSGLLNARGLIAAEYLLFYEGTDNACSATTSINTSGAWAALSADEIGRRKRAFAAALGADVASRGREIADAWAPDGGAFGARLAAAGGTGAPFASEIAAFNAIVDGIFRLEYQVKDLKLGRPLGFVDCPSTTCPDLVESLYARVARDHVRNNLIGLRRLFAGCKESDDVGFDDLLVTLNAPDTAARIVTAIDAVIVTADALPNPDFVQELATDPAELEELHASMKNLADTLRTEFGAVLDHVPPVIIGDPDN